MRATKEECSGRQAQLQGMTELKGLTSPCFKRYSNRSLLAASSGG